MIKIDNILKSGLNDKLKLVYYGLSNNIYKLLYPDMFGFKNVIEISYPLAFNNPIKLSDLIIGFMKLHKITTSDFTKFDTLVNWRDNMYCADSSGTRMRISKCLSKFGLDKLVLLWRVFCLGLSKLLNNPLAIKYYMNPQKLRIYISKSPLDVAGISANQYWNTCFNMDSHGTNKNMILYLVKFGVITAYMCYGLLSTIKKPLMALRIVPFIHKSYIPVVENLSQRLLVDVLNNNSMLYVSKKIYKASWMPFDMNFRLAVKQFIYDNHNKNTNCNKYDDYVINPKVYNDDRINSINILDGLPRLLKSYSDVLNTLHLSPLNILKIYNRFIGNSAVIGKLNEILINSSIDFNNMFVLAARNNSLLMMLFLLKNGNINMNTLDLDNKTALHYGVLNDNYDMVKLLCDHNVKVIRDYQNWTPLLYAVKYNHSTIVKLLIDNGVNVNRGSTYWTPLLYGCKENSVLSIKLLLLAGADVVCSTDRGWTPMHYTALHGNLLIAKWLIKRGAKLKLETRLGYTPLSIAIDKNNDKMVLLIQNNI